MFKLKLCSVGIKPKALGVVESLGFQEPRQSRGWYLSAGCCFMCTLLSFSVLQDPSLPHLELIRVAGDNGPKIRDWSSKVAQLT